MTRCGGGRADLSDGGIARLRPITAQRKLGERQPETSRRDHAPIRRRGQPGRGRHPCGRENLIGTTTQPTATCSRATPPQPPHGPGPTTPSSAVPATTPSSAGRADRLDGGNGLRDPADYSASTAWVNVNLTLRTGDCPAAAVRATTQGRHPDVIEDVNGSGTTLHLGIPAQLIMAWRNDTIDGAATTPSKGTTATTSSTAHCDRSLHWRRGDDTIYGGRTRHQRGGAGRLLSRRPNDGYSDLLFGGTVTDT
jgi:hypothetical protein